MMNYEIGVLVWHEWAMVRAHSSGRWSKTTLVRLILLNQKKKRILDNVCSPVILHHLLLECGFSCLSFLFSCSHRKEISAYVLRCVSFHFVIFCFFFVMAAT